MKHTLRLLFLLLFFSAFSQEAQLSPLTVDASLQENADSVLRKEILTLDITDPRYLLYKNYRVVSVYNKAGNSDVDAYASYDDNRQIKSIKATVYNVLGQEIETFKERDFKDVSAVSGGSLYEDSRVLYLDYTPTSYPYTVVFESEVKSKTTAFLPGWIPIGDYGSSTQFSKYEILFNPENKLTVKESNFEGYDIKRKDEPGHIVWTAENLTAVKKEYLSPSFKNHMPNLKCAINNFQLEGVSGDANNWLDFGKWMNTNLLQECNDLPQETIAEIKSLVSDKPDDEARARAVYKYVQDKVRYISIQVGIGGWKPMNASEVDRLGYGDCKALTNYTKNLLAAVDVPSYYTVLYAGDSKKSIDEDIVAMQGNHVILGVDLNDDITWLECTSQENPFGYLGDFTDDREVLMITDEGGILKHTTKYGIQENIESLNANIELMSDKVKGSFSQKSQGIFYSNGIGLSRLDNKDLNEYYLNKYKQVNSLRIDNINLENNRDSVVCLEDLTFEIPGYITDINGDLLLKPLIFTGGSNQIPPRYSKRRTSFIVERDLNYNQNLTYTLPEGYVLNDVPQPIELKTDFGKYSLDFSIDEAGRISCKRQLLVTSEEFEAEKYNDYRDFYKKISRYDNLKVLIKKKT